FHRMFDNNYEWSSNPYNKKKGGPVKEPKEFFTDEIAMKYFKRRLLYTIARWGYATSIMAWELFNDVDLTSDYDPDNVTQWHEDIASYIKRVDPHKHLITTSFYNQLAGMDTFSLDEIDYSQSHLYSDDIRNALMTIPQFKIDELNKPHITAEFGSSGRSALEEEKDKPGIRLHDSLWYSFFSGTLSSAMYWWWDGYVKKNDLYYHYDNFNKLIKGFDFSTMKKIEIKTIVKGIGDYLFTPILEEESPTGEQYEVSAGKLKGEGYLSMYFHGALQSDKKVSPEFEVNFLKDGYVEIMIEQVSDSGADLVIEVDYKKALEKKFDKTDFKVPQDVNSVYRVNVKKGTHIIGFKNTGKDWIRIKYIKFINSVNDVEIYGLKDDKSIYIWIKNRNFNFNTWFEKEKKRAQQGTVIIEDLLDQKKTKAYFYNTWKNELIKVENYDLKNGQFIIQYPEIERDILVVIRK
ncbi:MAG: hypothetical protein KKH98_05470, partial [Spirochaetes bacterium]|nr:hypothetical protein [Spirochaetota bacterium]